MTRYGACENSVGKSRLRLLPHLLMSSPYCSQFFETPRRNKIVQGRLFPHVTVVE